MQVSDQYKEKDNKFSDANPVILKSHLNHTHMYISAMLTKRKLYIYFLNEGLLHFPNKSNFHTNSLNYYSQQYLNIFLSEVCLSSALVCFIIIASSELCEDNCK